MSHTREIVIGWVLPGVIETFNYFSVKRKCFQLSPVEEISFFPLTNFPAIFQTVHAQYVWASKYQEKIIPYFTLFVSKYVKNVLKGNALHEISCIALTFILQQVLSYFHIYLWSMT